MFLRPPRLLLLLLGGSGSDQAALQNTGQKTCWVEDAGPRLGEGFKTKHL